jgi:hypothetical protein
MGLKKYSAPYLPLGTEVAPVFSLPRLLTSYPHRHTAHLLNVSRYEISSTTYHRLLSSRLRCCNKGWQEYRARPALGTSWSPPSLGLEMGSEAYDHGVYAQYTNQNLQQLIDMLQQRLAQIQSQIGISYISFAPSHDLSLTRTFSSTLRCFNRGWHKYRARPVSGTCRSPRRVVSGWVSERHITPTRTWNCKSRCCKRGWHKYRAGPALTTSRSPRRAP